MNLNTNTLLNMLSTHTNKLTNTQALKSKIEKLSVDGVVNIGTLTKDKTIGTLIDQLFKDIMVGTKTKGEITQLLSHNKNSFSFKNITTDIKSIVNYLKTLSQSPQIANNTQLSTKLHTQIELLKNSLLDMKNIDNVALKSNITNSGIFLESKLLKTTVPIATNLKNLLNQIKEHIDIKSSITSTVQNPKEQIKQTLQNSTSTIKNLQNQKEQPNTTQTTDTKIAKNIQEQSTSNTKVNNNLKSYLQNQQEQPTLNTKLNTQTQVQQAKQDIKVNTQNLQILDNSNNIKEEVKVEIKADVQKILQSIQTTQKMDIKPTKQILILKDIEVDTKNLEQKLEKHNIKNDIASNLKEVISQVKDQIVNKNLANIRTNILQLEEKISDIKTDNTKNELLNTIKEEIKSLKNNLINQPIQKDVLTQAKLLESKIQAPAFQVLFKNNRVNSANLSNDLKATMLQVKEQIDKQAHTITDQTTATKEIKATVEKVLSQIEFFQLLSYTTNSAQTPLSFFQEDVENSDIKFSSSSKDEFSCQINLTLKEHGELKVLLVLDKKNNLNINIGIENDILKQLAQSSLQSLRLGISKIGLSLQSLNIFTLDKQTENTNYNNQYENNNNLSFGLDIKA